jgi:3-oxoacyl-(acyl-carrier-protein) reductase
MDLFGKVSLVTGGSRGIGAATCIALAREKSDIVVNYASHSEAADEVVTELTKMGVRAQAYQADISDEEQARVMVERAVSEFGRVDVLVNNAGITRDRSFLKMTPTQWRQVLLVNLDGAFNITHAVLPQMVQRGWGRVINMSSVVAQMGNFGQANYAVAKGGLIAFTKTLAREVACKGITVNAIAPGFIETDMTADVPDDVLDIVRKMTPMGRLGKPEEVARAVRFLAAPEASFITGQVINVNGGMYM